MGLIQPVLVLIMEHIFLTAPVKNKIQEDVMRIGEAIKSCNPFVSLEFFPPSETQQLAEFYTVVEQLSHLKPLFASVTYGAGGSRQDNTFAVTAELVRRGFTAMAFLPALEPNPRPSGRSWTNLLMPALTT